MSINTKKKSHGFNLPLLLCLLFAFATFPVYSQQDLKTIRKDNKADKERLEKYADKKSQEIKQEEEMLRQMAEDSNKHILEAVEKKYYNEILKDLRDSVYQWQEKDEFEKTEDWITRLNKYSSEVFANFCNNKLSAIIAAPYERSAIIVSPYYYDYYKHNDYQSVSPIIIGNPYEIRLSEYDADKELFILAIFFDVQVRYEHFYTKYRTWDNNYFIDSDWKDTALYSFEHFFKLKKSISDAKLFKSKMETKVGIGIGYNLENYFYNYCICVPLEPSNYCFYHHRPIPKIIEFYDFEIDNLLVIRHFDYYEDIEWTPKYRLNKLDSIKRLNPWGAPKYVINVLENIDTDEIEDIIIYFDDLGIENPYLKGSYYNYTKQKFYQNPETAKLIAEEEARLQKIKAEQEQKRINDSIFQQADSILQSAIEDYHRYLKQLPYDTIENRIALSLPDSLNGKNQKLSETLNWLLDTVQSKKAEIATRYTNDSILFSKYNDKLHKLTETANARLLAYPYNLQQRTITDELPINLFGKEEELEKALQTKHAEILGMVEQVEEEVYRETRKKYPQDFMEIYYSQHPEQKLRADSAYKECHCDFLTRLSFDLAFFDGTLPECDCREGAYQQLNNLFHSREEFDKAYNLPIDDFKKEIANRERMFLKIIELSNYLAARPQLNLKKATLYDDDAQIRKILKSIDIHRNSYFYAEAIDAVFKNNEMLEQEWEKNGAYFTSKSEMFEYWIGTGYNKELKKRKKEKQ